MMAKRLKQLLWKGFSYMPLLGQARLGAVRGFYYRAESGSKSPPQPYWPQSHRKPIGMDEEAAGTVEGAPEDLEDEVHLILHLYLEKQIEEAP